MVTVDVPLEMAAKLRSLVNSYVAAKEQPGRFAHGYIRYDIVNGTAFIEGVSGDKDKVPATNRA